MDTGTEPQQQKDQQQRSNDEMPRPLPDGVIESDETPLHDGSGWDPTIREPTPPPPPPPKIRAKYLVSAISHKSCNRLAIACKSTIMKLEAMTMPNFVTVPPEVFYEAFKQPALPAATFFLEEEDVETIEDTYELGDHIKTNQSAVKILPHHYPNINEKGMGLAIEKSQGYIKILSYFNLGGTWIEDPEDIELYSLVENKSVKICQGTQVHDDYILPNAFPAKPKILKKAREHSELVIEAKKVPEKYQIIVGNNPEGITLDIFRGATGLAILALAEHNKRQAEDYSMWANFMHHRGILYSWRYTPKTLRELVEFKQIYAADSTITIRDDPEEKPIGMGSILTVNHPNTSLETHLRLTIAPTRRDDSLVPGDFDDREWIIGVPNNCPGLRARASTFREHIPKAIIQDERTLRSDILRALVGMPYRTQPVPLELPFQQHPRLNDGQNKAYRAIVHEQDRVVLVSASPGTGKTTLLAAAVADIVAKCQGMMKIACVTATNVSLLKLVEDISPLVSGQTRIQLIQSGAAKENYNEVASQFSMYQANAMVNELKKLTKDKEKGKDRGKDRGTVEKYEAKMRKRPKLADEKSMARVAAQNINFQIVFATTAMAEQLEEIMAQCNILIVDEAGQSSINTIIAFVLNMPKLEKLVMAGDPRQLGVHLKEIPEGLQKYGFRSVLNHTEEAGQATVVKLVTSYRSHPAIVQCLQHAAYGKDIMPGSTEDDKSEFLRAIPVLPNQKVPILLIDQAGHQQRDFHSYSMTNPQHTETVKKLVKIISNRMRPNSSITILCLYSHQASYLQNLGPNTTAATIDSFQAQQSDVVIVVTTRTRNNAGEREEALRFVNDQQRAIVALSRAVHGLVIVGDFSVLEMGEVWRRFLDQAKILVGKPVSSAYVDQLGEFCENNPSSFHQSYSPAPMGMAQQFQQPYPSQAQTPSSALFGIPHPAMNIEQALNQTPSTSSTDQQQLLHQLIRQQYIHQQQLLNLMAPPPAPPSTPQPQQRELVQNMLRQLLATPPPPPPPKKPNNEKTFFR